MLLVERWWNWPKDAKEDGKGEGKDAAKDDAKADAVKGNGKNDSDYGESGGEFSLCFGAYLA